MSPSGPAAEVQRLVEAGRYEAAAELLLGAASLRDPDALFTLALWRIDGSIIGRDLAAARRLMAEAGAAGHQHALLVHAAFLANGTGGAAEWSKARTVLAEAARWSPTAAAQATLLKAMDLDEEGRPVIPLLPERISAKPSAWIARALLSAAECKYLRALAEPWLEPSEVVDPATGRMVPHPIRSSDGASFGVTREDAVVTAINRRIAALSGTHFRQGEPLQILRYRPGAQYKAHFDALPPGVNQRILTVLVYLSDDYEGGETVFPRTGLAFRGHSGDALLFSNVTPDGEPDPLSLHAGVPVHRGVKTIATRWIRAEPFTYPPPLAATGTRYDEAPPA